MTGFMDRDRTPIEEAAAMLNTRHRTDDMHARRQEAILAGRSLLNVEQMARVLLLHTVDRVETTTKGDYLVCASCGALAAGIAATEHIAVAIRAAQLGEHA